MTKITITAVLLCCLLSTMAFAGESYLCVADMATGFYYNNALDKWEITNFKVNDSKYIVSKSEFKDYLLDINQLGKTFQFLTAEKALTKTVIFIVQVFIISE